MHKTTFADWPRKLSNEICVIAAETEKQHRAGKGTPLPQNSPLPNSEGTHRLMTFSGGGAFRIQCYDGQGLVVDGWQPISSFIGPTLLVRITNSDISTCNAMEYSIILWLCDITMSHICTICVKQLIWPQQLPTSNMFSPCLPSAVEFLKKYTRKYRSDWKKEWATKWQQLCGTSPLVSCLCCITLNTF